MTQETWTADEYPYRGVPAKPHMLAELAERHFPPGAVMTRKWLVVNAQQLHRELGGASTDAEPISQAKKARLKLLSGEWEDAGYGSIRRRGMLSDVENAEQIDAASVAPEAELVQGVREWLGEGDETVYCYTFPCHIELASLKVESRMPLKVGSTSFPTLDRVHLQCGTSNPERPVILFAIRTDDALLLEKGIQAILRIWDRWLEDAPGTEWFLTSKEEVLSIFEFLTTPPKVGECGEKKTPDDLTDRGDRITPSFETSQSSSNNFV